MELKTKMDKKGINRFLRKIMTKKDVDFSVKMFSDDSIHAFGALICVAQDCSSFDLEVNRCLITDIRCLLLHEIGHLESEEPHHRSASERELQAQLWAINRAKDLGWTNIAKELKSQLEKNWGRYKWNSPYRIYVLANRLAKKRGIIK